MCDRVAFDGQKYTVAEIIQEIYRCGWEIWLHPSCMKLPLIVQDGAMLNPSKGMRLDEDTAFQYVVQIALAVEKVGGVLTLLWHPNWIIQPDWWNLYLRTLKYLQEKNAWFGSVKEIGECWE